MSDFQLVRGGLMMEPEPGNPHETEGVLNPAATRGPDGALYLFPRLVGKNNYSRIGMARVRFDTAGNPVGVERLGIALEPEADYELGVDGNAGCEDPRITFVEPFQRYVMTYTARTASGPRIALAVSKDLFQWQRIGLARFESYRGIDFVGVDNKDASLFPIAVPSHCGKMELALLHRPLFAGSTPEETVHNGQSRPVNLDHESIWISYCPMALDGLNEDRPGHLGCFNSHHRLATPVAAWEQLKIGGGTPPILTRHGWMIVYHGVHAQPGQTPGAKQLCYSAGVMILSRSHPQKILYRSKDPILVPNVPQERNGVVANVVFPTGVDRREDLGLPDRYDVYYGMADSRIGVATMQVPQRLPSTNATTAEPRKREFELDDV